MNGLNDLQMKKLAEKAATAKKNGSPLSGVFAEFAAETGRAKGSIRNAYYAAVKRAQTDEKFAKAAFGSVKPSVAKIIGFNDAEARVMLKKVLNSATDGKSVRRSIAEISPDPKTALRYQNKYRNMICNESETVKEIMAEIKRERGECFNPYGRESDEMMARLKREINGLYDRLSENLRRENEKLKVQIAVLKNENARLKKGDENKDSVAKEYFESIKSGARRKIEFQK